MIKPTVAAAFWAVLSPIQIAAADPALRVVSFTADWCPTCRVLDPRLEQAIRMSDTSDIVLSQFDLSDHRSKSDAELESTHGKLALKWKVDEIWAQYRGRTGFAVIAAFDSGEALGCLGLGMDAARMGQQLDLAIRVVKEAAPDARPMIGPDCPDSQVQ